MELKEDGVSLAGEARNVAVRLDQAVAPGAVICSEATHRLIESEFLCQSLGPQKIKGVMQPVDLFQAQEVCETRGRIDAAGLTPLTGRDHKISLLKDRWEQAQEGMGAGGPAHRRGGVGQIAPGEHAEGTRPGPDGEVDAPVIEWRCSPHFRNTSLHPAIDFYERALGFGCEEPPQDRFDRLLHRLEHDDLAQPEAVPLWVALLSLPVPPRFPAISLSPVRQREATFRLMLDWLQTRAGRRATALEIERAVIN